VEERATQVHKDITAFYRFCPECQFQGLLRPSVEGLSDGDGKKNWPPQLNHPGYDIESTTK